MKFDTRAERPRTHVGIFMVNVDVVIRFFVEKKVHPSAVLGSKPSQVKYEAFINMNLNWDSVYTNLSGYNSNFWVSNSWVMACFVVLMVRAGLASCAEDRFRNFIKYVYTKYTDYTQQMSNVRLGTPKY